MQLPFQFCVLLASTGLVFGLAADTKASKVQTLTDQDFDERTSSGDWFLNVYAPWYDDLHSRHAAVTLTNKRASLSIQGVQVQALPAAGACMAECCGEVAWTDKCCQGLILRCISVSDRDAHRHSHLCPLPRFSAQVDGESNRLLAKRFLVEAYPSIYLIRAGKVYVYGGGHRSEQEASAAALTLHPVSPFAHTCLLLGSVLPAHCTACCYVRVVHYSMCGLSESAAWAA